MRRVLVLIVVTGLMGFLFCQLAEAKRRAPDVGSVETFSSENGKYNVEIKNLGYPDRSPSECTFKEGNKIIWSKEIPVTPGKVNIANNGESIVLANWGWYDEGGFKGLSFYNNKGELLKEINFAVKGQGVDGLIWIRETAISPDGMFYIFGIWGKEKSRLYLYDYKSANLLWEKEYGFEVVREIEMSDKSNSILVATYDNRSYDMLFVLLNRKGHILWQMKIEKNFSNNIEDYLHLDNDGHDFEIFDKTNGRYISYIVKDGKVKKE